MATFLDLCNSLARESGTVAGDPPMSSVVAQTGRRGLIVGWIQRAWRDIQLYKPNWQWMRAELEATTTPGVDRYTGAQLGQPPLRRWVYQEGSESGVTIYLETAGRDDEGHLWFVPWDHFRRTLLVGPQTPGRPTFFSIAPSNEIVLSPNPDAVYRIRAEYQKSPQALVANTDVPSLPEAHHDVIWRAALLYLAAYDENGGVQPQLHQIDLSSALSRLYADETPALTFAGPLGF